MAFFGAISKNVTGVLVQSISQGFAIDKKDAKLVSNFIRVNTKEYWKPAAALAAIGATAYGAYLIRTEIQKHQAELKLQPSSEEVRRLLCVADNVDNHTPDVGLVESIADSREDLSALENLADEFLGELLEFEDYLEVDSDISPNLKWIDEERRVEIVELNAAKEVSVGDVIEALGGDHSDSGPPKKGVDTKTSAVKAKSLETISKIVAEKQHMTNFSEFKKSRKRVRPGQLSNAAKALSYKIRASFPIPDGSALQQKAMCLYAAKECRKMNLRETQIAIIIPQAVSLSSVPTTDQVDMRTLTKMEPVALKYNKMAWSGYSNKSTWLTKLTSLFE